MAQVPLAQPVVVAVRAQPGLVAPGQQVAGQPGESGGAGIAQTVITDQHQSRSDAVQRSSHSGSLLLSARHRI